MVSSVMFVYRHVYKSLITTHMSVVSHGGLISFQVWVDSWKKPFTHPNFPLIHEFKVLNANLNLNFIKIRKLYWLIPKISSQVVKVANLCQLIEV